MTPHTVGDGKASGLELITDEQRLVSAHNEYCEIRTYDDGYGSIWIHRDSRGISGIVRAGTWEDAYEICEDAFFAEANATVEELQREYGFKREYVKVVENGEFARWDTVETRDDTPGSFKDNALFQEAYGFRPNGPNSADLVKHGIYERDLNGEYLEELTVKLAAELGIAVQVEDEE